MTTVVIVANNDKNMTKNMTKNIKIEIQERDANGRFTGTEEFFIYPGEFREVTVHDSKSFQVIEVDASPRAVET